MPFDQFTIEQLAGDLLPNATTRAEDRHRLPPQHVVQRGGRHRPRAVPRRADGRPRQHDRGRLARPHRRLRPVPRPQVRPGLAEGLLPALRLLQLVRRADDADRRPAGPGRHDREAATRWSSGSRRTAAAARTSPSSATEIKRVQGKVPTTLVMRERPTPRQTFVQIRGDFLRKGDEVQPGYPDRAQRDAPGEQAPHAARPGEVARRRRRTR